MSVSGNDQYELLPGQLGIWRALQLVPDNSVYNVAECLRVDGDLDVGLFEAAARLVLGEAGALRIRLCGEGELPRQCVGDVRGWKLHHTDVSGAADPEAAAAEWMQADRACPVDLRGGPLFTAALFTVAPGRFLWYQRAHHIAMDGFSGWACAARIAGIYTALAAGTSPAARALQPFATLLEADAAYRASADFGADREFWAGTLAGFSGAVSLSGRPAAGAVRVPVRSGQELGAVEHAGLRAAARRLGTGLSGLAVAAAAVCLHRCTGEDDVVVGVSVSGRGGRERRVPGMTANVVPVRLRMGGQLTAGELARQVSGAVRAALRHQRYLVLVQVHHLVADRTAHEVIVGEVAALLAGRGGAGPGGAAEHRPQARARARRVPRPGLPAGRGRRQARTPGRLLDAPHNRAGHRGPLPCTHAGMVRPEMLARAWSAISAWLAGAELALTPYPAGCSSKP
jgi:hypothetical protein